VIVHLTGNLQIFLGPEMLNRYGRFLQTTPEVLWPARAGLIFLAVLHIASAARLSAENKRARPMGYALYEIVAASYASRTMMMSGLIVVAFVIYHLLHFTIHIPGLTVFGKDFTLLMEAKASHDIYRMMVIGFKQPLVSAFYVLAMALLCLHLSHGASSMFQTMGFKNKYYGRFIDRAAKVAAVLIFIGYCSIPVAVLSGFIRLQ
jgi:succinate dehydrogenase / fumarate reductase cytochrome b subunit